MAAPQIGGVYTGRIGSSMQVSIDISSIPDGAWMILSAMGSVSTTALTHPAGWTVVADKVATGTRTSFLFVKIKTTEDGNSITLTQNVTNATAYSLLWGGGSLPVQNWVMGAQWVRGTNSSEASGSRYSNVAKSVTTTSSNNLVLAISYEATLAMTQSNEIAGITPSGQWTPRAWLPQVAVNDRVETIWIGTKELAVAGASGDATVAYTSPQDNNGWAMQIAIPPASSAPSTPVLSGEPTTFVGSSSSGFTISRPAGVVNGDYVVVALRGQSSTTSVAPSSPGFTRLGPAFAYSDASARMAGFYGHPVTDAASEPTLYSFTFTSEPANTRLVATAFVVKGVDFNNPVAGFYDSYTGGFITGGRQVQPYALDDTPVIQLFMGAAEFAAPNSHVPFSLPGGYSTVQELSTSTNTAVSRTYLWVGAKETSQSPTATDSIVWGTPSGACAEGISLRMAGAEPSDPAGKGYVLADGSGDEVKMYHISSSGVRTPSSVVSLKRGFASVAEMLATPGFTWAHRGGSISYAEMSLYGYTQCVARGYGVLEVSLARTSDGVWFGLHDQTTDRTSGGTYGNASSQTWAQVQAQRIVVGGQGAPQPYMRWEELVAAYGQTHILVVDPKYALGSYRTEFLTMVNDSLGPQRAIIKYSGPGSGAAALSTQAQAMGFETWGFFYASDASATQGGNGALQTWGPSWTFIGMEYGASQAIWNEALALGKPVIGHIAPTQSAYDMAIAKGASGVQVSGVAVVEPISWWSPPPVAAWNFSEGGGDVAGDVRGVRSLAMTAGNWATGHKGAGLSATGGRVVVPDKAGLETQRRTLMFWANWAGNGSNWRWGVDFHITALDTSCWGIMPISGSGELYCRIRIGSTNTNIILNNNATNGEWHHYAITYDGKNFIAYRDGVVLASMPVTGTIDSCDEVIIHPDGGSNVVDNLRMFNKALTQAQIVQQMNS